jgi:hypothetical protein
MTLATAALAFSAVSALGSIRQGQAQANQLIARGQGLVVQADFTRLRGRQEALKSKREAVNGLQAILENLARVTAVAGAGNVDAFTGNALGAKNKTLNVGGLNVVVSKENAVITRLVANFQARQFEFQAAQAFAAAGAARTAGITSALVTLGAGVFQFGALGGFGASTPPVGGAAAGATNASAVGNIPQGLPSFGNTFNPAPFQFQGFGTTSNAIQRI